MIRNKSDYSLVIPIDKTNENQHDQASQSNNISDILQLLENGKKEEIVKPEEVNRIRKILEKNKHLINYQHCKDNKLRSLLHIVKYNSKLQYENKQEIVNMIVDVGYKLFKSSSDVAENCHALFFTAAKGDYATLKKIVDSFTNIQDIEKLHDTKEGDNVLSFMVKFGDLTQNHYLDSFEFLLKQNIDSERIDYYKNDIKGVITKEKAFLEELGNENEYYGNKLVEVERILEEHNTTIDGVKEHDPVLSKIRNKHKLFHSIIARGEDFKPLLDKNLLLVNSDDGENTLLQLAIVKNSFEITKELLQNGADPNHVVKGRNEEHPLILAAKLNRDRIFQEILRNKRLNMTNDMFAKCVSGVKSKFLNYLLESDTLDVNFHYNGNTPLYYAIVRKNRAAIQSLMQRGSRLTENCLSRINPKDLEEYLNSCVKFDSFKDNLEENDYKSFLVFDFFIDDHKELAELGGKNKEPNTTICKFSPEIETIRKIGTNKRLSHLLEHPLIFIFIMLKWYRVTFYYFVFVFLKLIFYLLIVFLAETGFLNLYLTCFVLVIQFLIVSLNCLEFKYDFGRYTLHFVLEILIALLLIAVLALKIVSDVPSDVNQVSAFILVLISISMLLTIGYHVDLSKWMSMAKRVFKNFTILLLFFLLPILAFAMAFQLLLPFQDKEAATPKENEDFKNIPRAIFRTFVMLGGDLGDKRFTSVGGYLVFLLFAIGMAIILMNFWTGVAVSDIKEIEEQSTIVAFNNVIVFIESVEKIYQFIDRNFLEKCIPSRWKHLVYKRLPLPFLKSKIKVKSRKRQSKFRYGMDLFINSEVQFKNNKFFKPLRLENDIIFKVKSLCDEKEVSGGDSLKHLLDQVKRIEGLVKSNKDLHQNCSCSNKPVNKNTMR